MGSGKVPRLRACHVPLAGITYDNAAAERDVIVPDVPRVEVVFTPEPAREGTEPTGFYPRAIVRVWYGNGCTEHSVLGPARAVPTHEQANALMRPLVNRWLKEKGWKRSDLMSTQE